MVAGAGVLPAVDGQVARLKDHQAVGDPAHRCSDCREPGQRLRARVVGLHNPAELAVLEAADADGARKVVSIARGQRERGVALRFGGLMQGAVLGTGDDLLMAALTEPSRAQKQQFLPSPHLQAGIDVQNPHQAPILAEKRKTAVAFLDRAEREAPGTFRPASKVSLASAGFAAGRVGSSPNTVHLVFVGRTPGPRADALVGPPELAGSGRTKGSGAVQGDRPTNPCIEYSPYFARCAAAPHSLVRVPIARTSELAKHAITGVEFGANEHFALPRS